MYILDILDYKEIVNQTTMYWITKGLSNNSNKLWPTFPIKIDLYSIQYKAYSIEEEKALRYILLDIVSFYNYNPIDIVSTHLKVVMYSKIYGHYDPPFENFLRNIIYFDEALPRLFTTNNHMVQERFQTLREERYLCFL